MGRKVMLLVVMMVPCLKSFYIVMLDMYSASSL